MDQQIEGCLLRIFISERLKHDGKPLHEWIIVAARKAGLAGATAWRGMMGFGANSRIHTAKIMRLSDDLPVIIEMVDTRDRLAAFLTQIDGVITEGLATMEAAQIHFYRSRNGEERIDAT